MASFSNKRLQKELAKLTLSGCPEGITLVEAANFKNWTMDIRVLDGQNPLYANQTYRLSFTFSSKYPIEAPHVLFMQSQDPPRPIPIHPHIYSNGVICLDLLGSSGWSPVQNVESVCLSLQSMLTGNTRNERPQGNEAFVREMGMSPGSLANVRFDYDDNTV